MEQGLQKTIQYHGKERGVVRAELSTKQHYCGAALIVVFFAPVEVLLGSKETDCFCPNCKVWVTDEETASIIQALANATISYHD